MTVAASLAAPLTTRRILQTWWPLAASWLLMGVELPLQSAFVARLANPEINLAAFGSVAMPVMLIFGAPIIMLLTASTALCKDWDSYLKVRRFTLRAAALLTTLHVLVAFTPLYYLVVSGLIGPPQEVIEPARVGLMIMTPWLASIAFRRFNQGVLIRFGHSQAVGQGTLIRLVVNVVVLTTGYLAGTVPGVVVAASALVAGVTSEALFIGLRVRPVLRHQLRWAKPVDPALTFRTFTRFYVPLALTQLMAMFIEPVVSAALSRLPNPLESLAVWPILFGLIFMMQSPAVAYVEVVVALLEQPDARNRLRRFTSGLVALTFFVPVIVYVTPLSSFWFGRVSALAPPLVEMAQQGLWIGLPIAGLTALCSWYQGVVVHVRHTRSITEAVAIYMLTIVAILGAGVAWGRVMGLYVGAAAFSVGFACQASWLWWRSRPALRIAVIEGENT